MSKDRSMGEPDRSLIGVWLLVAPWVLAYDSLAAMLTSLVVGAIMALLAAARGRLTPQPGGGWRAVWTGDPRR